MIRINLAPIEELDNQFWWLPDAAIFALVLAVTLTGVKFYLGTTEDEIARLQQDQATLEENLRVMEPELQRYQVLNTKIKDLENLGNSLGRITESKLARYLPIILLEHIQNLRPEGVWLTGIQFKNRLSVDGGTTPATSGGPVEIEISGQAYDNVILAEFMTLLKATRNQEYDAADLRTQAFFDAVGLYFSDVKTGAEAGAIGGGDTIAFKLGVTFQERAGPGIVDQKLSKYLDEYRKRRL